MSDERTKLSSVAAVTAAANLQWDVTLPKYRRESVTGTNPSTGATYEGWKLVPDGEEILTIEVEMDFRGMLREMALTLQHSKSRKTKRWGGLAKAKLINRRAGVSP